MADFLREKWGDVIALMLIYTGAALTVFVTGKGAELGSGLVMAGIGLLKLTRTYGGKNGNGNGTPS